MHFRPFVLPRGPISQGERTGRVAAIQSLLGNLKYPISNTGAFGVHTHNFVKQFQSDENLPETGPFLEFRIDRETLIDL
jgi:peptidoglycan hydrolase-like protein with peptidoglycan-binding domain